MLKELKQKVKCLEEVFVSKGWRSLGDEIKTYVVPDRGRFLNGDSETESDKGDYTLRQEIYDDTGEQSNNFLVSGFMSMLVPETSKWMKMRPGNPALKESKNALTWCDSVSDLILSVFSRADVYGTLYNTFTEFCSFGTGAQLLDSDEVETIRPKSFTFGEFYFATGPNGKPNTFAYKSWWTAYQLKEEFGDDALSQRVKDSLNSDKGKYKKFLVWHLIEPNDGRTKGISAPNGMPFSSIYFEAQAPDSEDKVLRIGGYDEFPAQIPRWLTISNDIWGKESPGCKQLSAIKMLQTIVESRIIATERIGDPPLYSNGDFNKINSMPGGITYGMDAIGGKPSVSSLFDNYRPDISALLVSEESTRSMIEKGFFNPLFLIVSDTSDAKRMTATEVMARNEEKFAMLSPVLNRVFNELLIPMIDRTFNILQRQGYFDENGPYPVPPELVDVDIDIEFDSVLALAQKAVGLNNIDRFLERMGLLAQLDPSALDGLDTDEIVNTYGQNVPAKVLRDIEERIALREQRALEQQAAAQMAAMESSAGITQQLANSPVGTGSALDEIEEA